MAEKRILKGVNIQFNEPDLERIDGYRRSYPIVPTRTATIRGLILLGLKAATAESQLRSREGKRPSIQERSTTGD